MRVFWVNIAISKLNLLYRYCLKLIGELKKEKEFWQQCCQNSTKIRREKDKKVERERRGISATLLPKFLYPNFCLSCVLCEKKQLRQCHCRNRKKRKFFFGNCGNGIAENGKKKIWMELWQCHCRKWEEKKNLLPKSGKKFLKKCYIHNIFIILSQQITGD